MVMYTVVSILLAAALTGCVSLSNETPVEVELSVDMCSNTTEEGTSYTLESELWTYGWFTSRKIEMQIDDEVIVISDPKCFGYYGFK